uniref:Uncharacterized protein n=1 Tax=Anopheles arabiensis TaxID=7173 RepID=A0A182IFH9_ANOAR
MIAITFRDVQNQSNQALAPFSCVLLLSQSPQYSSTRVATAAGCTVRAPRGAVRASERFRLSRERESGKKQREKPCIPRASVLV